jgi:hypothetical protein
MTKISLYLVAYTLTATVEVHIIVHLSLVAAVLAIMISGERSA